MSHNKYVVVTGATSGIGLAVCELLTEHGFGVIAVGRSTENCEKAERRIKSQLPDAQIVYFYGDLAHQSEVIGVADKIIAYLSEHADGALWGLINNAGCVRSRYMTSDEGYEQQFALNHLSGFLLSLKLMPQLQKGRGRILFTSSESHKAMKMRWHDLMFQKRYNPLMAYKQSKLCNVLTAFELNQRFCESGITAYAIDPGLVDTGIGCKETGSLVRFIWERRRKHGVAPEVPARTYLHLLSEDEHFPGLYFCGREPKGYSKEVNYANAKRLYEISEKLCGIGEKENLT